MRLQSLVHLFIIAFCDQIKALTGSDSRFSNATISGIIERLELRQAIAVSTCGFKDGDADKPRTADPGYDCRVDTQHALWGFCPTTVISATDCGLAGNCVDSNGCSNGCGITGISGITTFTCTGSGANFCSTALLTAGPDQTYSYIACANAAITDHLEVEATTTSTTATSAPSSTSPSSTSSSSTSPSSSVSPSQTTPSPTQLTPSSTLSVILSTTPYQVSTMPISTPNSQSSTSNNVGAIVGGVVGGLALICFVVLAAIFLRRYRRDNYRNTAMPPKNTKNTQRYDAGTQAYDGMKANYQHWNSASPVELPTQNSHSPFELTS